MARQRRMTEAANPTWTRSPIQTRARTRKENPPTSSDDTHNKLVPVEDYDDTYLAAALAPRDTNVSRSRQPAARRRLTDVPGALSGNPRRLTACVLVPQRPAQPPPSCISSAETKTELTHTVSVPGPAAKVEDEERPFISNQLTLAGEVKVEATEPSIRSVDLNSLPVSRRQRRKTLVFERRPEEKPGSQHHLAASPYAPVPVVSPPVGILIASDTSTYVTSRRVHFTPPATHHGSSSVVTLSSGLACDEVVSPDIESASLSTLLQPVFASLVQFSVFLFNGVTLGLPVLAVLILVILAV